ncbi:MAG: asparagine synthetase B, partial [Planctomycetes bacterium]|nr:asparagine synthetase B [Planctomycetota bacterium]
MCSILAILGLAAGDATSLRPLAVERSRAMRHRGPDWSGVFACDTALLVHERLAIVDVLGGAQPLVSPDGRYALAVNGEIYNHRELRGELAASGARPRTHSDGEVIVHGYLRWGLLGMLRRLRGMFAFALFDTRDGSFHLARDPLGIKPLYHARTPWGLVFGSEMKAVLAALPARPSLSARGLLQCASLGYALSPETIFEGVQSLEPGT